MKNSKWGWLFNRYFILVTLFNLAGSIILQMYNSTISLHVDALNQPAVLAGTITSVGAITALCYRIFGGALCEKCGRRRLLTIGFPLFGGASLLMSLTSSVPLIFLLRIVQMIGYAATTTTVSVAVVDITPKAHMTEGIGYFGLATSLASAIGPSIALALFDTSLHFRAVMLVSCVTAVIATVCVLLFFGYEKDERFDGNLLNRPAPPQRKAIASSTFMLPYDVAFMFSSILWGTMIDRLSFRAVFTCAACVVGLALVLSILLFHKKPVNSTERM